MYTLTTYMTTSYVTAARLEDVTGAPHMHVFHRNTVLGKSRS